MSKGHPAGKREKMDDKMSFLERQMWTPFNFASMPVQVMKINAIFYDMNLGLQNLLKLSFTPGTKWGYL